MGINSIKDKIKNNPRLKDFLLNCMVNPVLVLPRLWLRLLFPYYIKRGGKSHIYRSVRKDIVPFNRFELGKRSVVESFSVINNMIGDIIIGDNVHFGLSNTIIGPVKIENDVILAQNVTLSGLNHNFEDINQPISRQGVSKAPVIIESGAWIGANSVIPPGVTIGKNSVLGAGSIVVSDIPPYSLAVGSPAKVIKRFDHDSGEWKKLK